ncbi:interleukin-6 receptor subunit beta-like [Sinocyclocheilus anshuiensis]|uniref:Interleukin-6 receptor subunit beta-like n=1 Tax=Sinocyclocheilus anshuiensis TaxID=1608454 RepID=A0A671LXS8_9TELE|nr:PREDICTED: interleukin-6 receptor subunit beta-like [Sinocyclocheilus anshuiensis]
MDTSHHLLLLLMFLHYAIGSNSSCVKILPDSSSNIVLEVGKNFTATCHLLEGSVYTSDDIEWRLENISIAKQFYRKINETAVSVTVNVSSDMSGLLRCRAAKESLSYAPQCIYGIFLRTGYPPLKPKNLSCLALQEGKDISSYLNCSWDPGSRSPLLDTNYTLTVNVLASDLTYKAECNQHLARYCVVNLETFQIHMLFRVWVEVKNALGSERSDELQKYSAYFVKPNPPLNVRVLTEVNISTSLMVTWKHPVHETVLKLSYAIRYCKVASDVWVEVPESFTEAYMESFRLQSLEPYTQYVVQMRCIGESHSSHWSNWSASVTGHTAEAKPASAPDLWRIIQPTSNNRNVTLVWKAPVKTNGKILKYYLNISQDYVMFESHTITDKPRLMYSMELPPGKTASIELAAVNSVGASPKATLFIPRSDQELPGVGDMRWSVRDEKPEPELQVEWTAVPSRPAGLHLFHYLLEWVKIPQNVHQTELQAGWQRVSCNVTNTTLNGDLEKFKRYNISVYPIYKYHVRHTLQTHFLAGRPVTRPAYIQQGPPEKGPTVTVTKSKKNSAALTWEEIPLDRQRGFITDYTIFYEIRNTKQWKSVTVSPNVHSYALTDLASETDYVVNIMASTVAGSEKGMDCTFKTMKYGDGEVEVIVVVVCLSFLFLTVFIIMLCLWKREVIKKLLWPQVPDPSDSSIAHWSPDFPIKADVPKEDVSVVEVDVFDGKSLSEEDKAVLPLKKDKYLSEEHSSGIGGSSCMSSPHHSVSDIDSGDSGQTTASTVQYSSVVAGAYKGQTPSHQPPAFARSESTQPLLDCEEHPDHLSESGGQSRSSYFRRGRELELGVLGQECDGASLTFCPVQEETSPVAEDPPALCYMQQQSGYLPQ